MLAVPALALALNAVRARALYVTASEFHATVEVILNSKDPLERQFAEQTINARVSEVEQAVSKQVLRVAVSDLQQVLNGGKLNFLGQQVPQDRARGRQGRRTCRTPRLRAHLLAPQRAWLCGDRWHTSTQRADEQPPPPLGRLRY